VPEPRSVDTGGGLYVAGSLTAPVQPEILSRHMPHSCLSRAFPGTQAARSLLGGPVRTVGTYSSSCSLPSNVRLATISRPTSGYPS